LKNIFTVSLVLLAISIIPSSFAWDGEIAIDADKRNVELGQVIKYKGHIYGDYPIDGQVVSITVYEKDSKRMILRTDVSPDPKSVKYFENTAWPFTFEVGIFDEKFESDKIYVVEAKYGDKSTKLDFFIQSNLEPTCLEILGDRPIIVLTDKEKYDQGDVISVSGCLSGKAPSKEISIMVYDPEGNIIGTSALTPNSDRTFSENFIIDKRFGLNGTYSLDVDAGGLYHSTKSFVVPEFGSVAMIIFAASFTFVLFNKKIFRQLTNFT